MKDTAEPGLTHFLFTDLAVRPGAYLSALDTENGKTAEKCTALMLVYIHDTSVIALFSAGD